MSLEFAFDQFPVVFEQKELVGENRIIHERALIRAQRYLIAEAELLESIIEIDKSRLYENFGLTHLTPYCVQFLGLSENVAATFVRVARKTYEVPELKTAIEEGKLTVTKAKAITSVINSDNQQDWIKKAETLSKSKLEIEVAYNSPKSIKPEKAKIEGPDRVRYEFDLTEKEAELFRRAQDILSQKTGTSVSLSETQGELLKCFLDRYDPVRKAQRKTQRKTNKMDPSRDRSEKKTPPSTKARTETRTRIKAEVIHAVNLRDQGKCQAQLPDGRMCGQSKWLHYHHIIPKAKGGKDTVENLITLCSAHHRIWHARE